MLTETNIIEINKILSLCGVARMTTSEIDYLNAIGTTVTDDCGNYKVAQTVILDRLKSENCSKNALPRLYYLAEANSCSLQEKKVEKPEATVMLLGGGLR